MVHHYIMEHVHSDTDTYNVQYTVNLFLTHSVSPLINACSNSHPSPPITLLALHLPEQPNFRVKDPYITAVVEARVEVLS